MPHPKKRQPLTFLRELCCDLPPDKVREAEEKFWQYLETVHVIFTRQEGQRVSDELLAIPKVDSTIEQSDSTIPIP